MEKFEAAKLPESIVTTLLEFKDNKLDELKKEGLFLNTVLREDILPLLDRYCTVVYYPIEDCENNGFHKTYLVNGEKKHFVYINTNQTREKQIFTAAHELGHVWKLDDYFNEILNEEYSFELGERIMNRFAAELLMPKELFLSFLKNQITKAGNKESVTVGEMVQIITAIMNEFFAPYKAVLYRLYELDCIPEDAARLLWGEFPYVTRDAIEDYSKKYALEQGYNRLYQPDGRKLIDHLKNNLEKARRSGKLPDEWILEFYHRFELDPEEPDEVLQQQIDISKGEEN